MRASGTDDSARTGDTAGARLASRPGDAARAGLASRPQHTARTSLAPRPGGAARAGRRVAGPIRRALAGVTAGDREGRDEGKQEDGLGGRWEHSWSHVGSRPLHGKSSSGTLPGSLARAPFLGMLPVTMIDFTQVAEGTPVVVGSAPRGASRPTRVNFRGPRWVSNSASSPRRSPNERAKPASSRI
jgi:hypothetical protein